VRFLIWNCGRNFKWERRDWSARGGGYCKRKGKLLFSFKCYSTIAKRETNSMLPKYI